MQGEVDLHVPAAGPAEGHPEDHGRIRRALAGRRCADRQHRRVVVVGKGDGCRRGAAAGDADRLPVLVEPVVDGHQGEGAGRAGPAGGDDDPKALHGPVVDAGYRPVSGRADRDGDLGIVGEGIAVGDGGGDGHPPGGVLGDGRDVRGQRDAGGGGVLDEEFPRSVGDADVCDAAVQVGGEVAGRDIPDGDPDPLVRSVGVAQSGRGESEDGLLAAAALEENGGRGAAPAGHGNPPALDGGKAEKGAQLPGQQGAGRARKSQGNLRDLAGDQGPAETQGQ